jgi:hypothetical protein
MNIESSDPLSAIPALFPKHGRQRRVETLESFIISGLSPAGAVLFTNPFDTAKYALFLTKQTFIESEFNCNRIKIQQHAFTKLVLEPSRRYLQMKGLKAYRKVSFPPYSVKEPRTFSELACTIQSSMCFMIKTPQRQPGRG